MEASAVPRHDARQLPAPRSSRLLRVASDERLVGLVRLGSAPAFEALYERHHRGILSFCRHMLASREEAEDAVQHTFLSAYSALRSSERPMQLRAWLYTIARNRCITVLRARREQATGAPEAAATTGLAEQVEHRLELRELLADLGALPEDQRAALVLAELGALSHAEIAGVLGVPREKVKALVFQAREFLLSARSARDTDCREIREQLATLTGGALRRAPLRRHLAGCPSCREFKAGVRSQHQALAIVLPVIPSLALKHGALPGAAGAGGAAVAGGATAASGGSAAGAGLAVAGAKAVVLKVVLITVVAGAGTAGGIAAVEQAGSTPTAPAHKRVTRPAAVSSGAAGHGPAAAAASGAERVATIAPGGAKAGSGRRKGAGKRAIGKRSGTPGSPAAVKTSAKGHTKGSGASSATAKRGGSSAKAHTPARGKAHAKRDPPAQGKSGASAGAAKAGAKKRSPTASAQADRPAGPPGAGHGSGGPKAR